MNDTMKEGRSTVYEIGYLISTSIPEEKVLGEVDKIKSVITDAGSTIIADENPQLQQLAYTIRVKTFAGSYDKHDEAHFGWVKFEVVSSKIEEIKKTIEKIPSVIRILVITTIKENTYLGKRAETLVKANPIVLAEDKKVANPATVEEMDKSIDDMVKEV